MSQIIPQVLVTLSPQGELQAELPVSGSRRVIPLGKLRQAGQAIMDLLLERKAEIEHAQARRAEQEAEARRSKRKRAQPDWRLIAKHPEAEIRERMTKAEAQVTICPQSGSKLTTQRSRVTLEEMGL